jgi:hypothetical protein
MGLRFYRRRAPLKSRARHASRDQQKRSASLTRAHAFCAKCKVRAGARKGNCNALNGIVKKTLARRVARGDQCADRKVASHDLASKEDAEGEEEEPEDEQEELEEVAMPVESRAQPVNRMSRALP